MAHPGAIRTPVSQSSFISQVSSVFAQVHARREASATQAICITHYRHRPENSLSMADSISPENEANYNRLEMAMEDERTVAAGGSENVSLLPSTREKHTEESGSTGRTRYGNARVMKTPGPVFSGRKTNADYDRTRA